MCKVLEGRELIYIHITLWLIVYLKGRRHYVKTDKDVKARESSEINYLTLVQNHTHGNWQEEVSIQICTETMTFSI